jgi:hypothetical protein
VAGTSLGLSTSLRPPGIGESACDIGQGFSRALAQRIELPRFGYVRITEVCQSRGRFPPRGNQELGGYHFLAQHELPLPMLPSLTMWMWDVCGFSRRPQNPGFCSPEPAYTHGLAQVWIPRQRLLGITVGQLVQTRIRPMPCPSRAGLSSRRPLRGACKLPLRVAGKSPSFGTAVIHGAHGDRI